MLSIDHFSLLCLLTEHTIILRYVTPLYLTHVPIFLTICCHCLFCSFLEVKSRVSIRNVCQILHPITHLNVSSKRLPNSAPHYTLQCVSETSANSAPHYTLECFFETSAKLCSPLHNSMCLRNVCQTLHPFTHYNVSPKRLPNSAPHYKLQFLSETSAKLCTPLHTTIRQFFNHHRTINLFLGPTYAIACLY